jgi:hypothetical protein
MRRECWNTGFVFFKFGADTKHAKQTSKSSNFSPFLSSFCFFFSLGKRRNWLPVVIDKLRSRFLSLKFEPQNIKEGSLLI